MLELVVATALAEGIKFLYGQGAELLRSWRERRQAGRVSAQDLAGGTPPEGLFDGTPTFTRPDPDVLAHRATALAELLTQPALIGVLSLGDPADPSNDEQVKALAALRAVLEEIYGERLTLVGEPDRPKAGELVVRGRATAEQVYGVLAGVIARNVLGADIYGTADTKFAGPDSRVAGVVLDNSGGGGQS
ncbi:MAG TPA: hypothetical protein VGG05_21270 [Pseudonocardiaceae bacterium]|jgi:hypothetical protein